MEIGAWQSKHIRCHHSVFSEVIGVVRNPVHIKEYDERMEKIAKDVLTSPSFCTTVSERVYITANGCEIEFGGAHGLQAAGAGGL